jgi:hypothetical protein
MSSSCRSITIDDLNESDFRTRHRAFEYPSLAEKSDILAPASKLREDISDIDARIRELEEYLWQCDSLCSPIRKLPNNILSLIFSFCGVFTRIYDISSDDRHYIPGFALELVCSRWHAVVASTPTLWTYLSIEILCGTEENFGELPEAYIWDATVQMLYAFLDRSDLPLDVEFATSLEVVHDSPLAQCLFASAGRWRSLDFTDIAGVSDDFFNGLIDELPLLERLSLNITAEHCPQLDFRAFLSAPRLAFLHTTGCQYSLELAQKVTEISLHRMPLNFFLELASMSRTRKVSIELMDRSEASLAYDAECTSLETLELAVKPSRRFDECRGLINRAFNHFRAPNLKHLIIDTREFRHVAPPHMIKAFLLNSGCQLDSLAFCRTPMGESALLEMLSCTPSIKNLTLDDYTDNLRLKSYYLTPRALEAFENDPRLLPNLRHLEIKSRCKGLAHVDIAKMVVRRATRGLKTFILRTLCQHCEAAIYRQQWCGLFRSGFHAQVECIGDFAVCSCSGPIILQS